MLDLHRLEELIESHLRERLAAYGFAHADVRVGQDHDGDATIFVVANYRSESPPLDPLASLTVATELNRMLGHEGDERFVHLTHAWADEAPLSDTQTPRRRSGVRA